MARRLPWPYLLANPVNAHFAPPFTYSPPGGAFFNFTLPPDYQTGDDITVEVQALLFNFSQSPLTPDAANCWLWGWGGQVNDGWITDAPSNDGITIQPGSEVVQFIRATVTGEPIQQMVTAVNTNPQTLSFVVPGKNETAPGAVDPAHMGWIIGDAGFPPVGPLPPGTPGTGVTYPDAFNESSATSLFIGPPGAANNGYLASSTLSQYQVAANSKRLRAGSQISILMQLSSFGGVGPALQLGIGSITVITTGGRRTNVQIYDVHTGWMDGVDAPAFGYATGEYFVNGSYPDSAVNGGLVPLYDAAYSNLYLYPLNYSSPDAAMIPLPDPHYAGNPNLVFYPWGKKGAKSWPLLP